MEFLSNIGPSGDVYRPSVFELIAQDKMRDLLKPALRYVLTVYAQRYPRHLLRIVNKHDELFALLMLLIEQHYLREWNASFTEHFYGLKREPNDGPRRRKGVRHLSSSQIWRSLAFLVVLPYAKTKLDETYESITGGPGGEIFGDLFRDDADEGNMLEEPLQVRLRKRAKKIFRTIYPYCNATYQAFIFIYQLGYMYRKTDYFSPWLHLCGLQLRRMSLKDYREHDERQQAAEHSAQSALKNASRLRVVRYMLATILSRGFDFLKYALPMSIFFFKFLEWWYSSEYHKQAGHQPIPPPPEILQPNPDGLPLPEDPSICPICIKPRTNPTMLPSGYVFCYPCVFKYVEEHTQCPVTLLTTNTEELRKIYSV